MADQRFVGEIILGGFNFAPRGHALCNGQLLPISQNTALFSLLGTTYGGNGQTTFSLPDLQGRIPIGFEQGPGLSDYSLGQIDGEPSVTLQSTQIPAHNHNILVNSGDGTQSSPINNYFAGAGADKDLYSYNAATSGGASVMNATNVSLAGLGQPHNNMMPYLAINYFIALEGIFPSRN